LLTGRTPFTGPPATVLHHILNDTPPSPRTIVRWLPRDLERITLKAMSRRVEDRYSSCEALANDLRRWLDGDEVRARPLGRWERGLRWLKREPILVGASVIASLSLLAAIVVPIITAAWYATAVRAQERAQERAATAADEAEKAENDAREQKEKSDKAL